jgi:deoxyribodipyrimidine photo-lyase
MPVPLKPVRPEVAIFWFRRDLRLDDNAGLFHALKENKQVVPVFIFDTDILDQLENKKDRRVEFIWYALAQLKKELEALNSSLFILHDTPLAAFEKLLDTYNIHSVYTNHDYEPSAIRRDEHVHKLLNGKHITFHTFKDQVIFEKEEVCKDDGSPYTVFTPYMRKWKSRLNEFYRKAYPVKKYVNRFIQVQPFSFPSLKQIGFESAGLDFKPPVIDRSKIRVYDKQRDYPALDGTTHLGVHLRFGTVSIVSS